MSFVPWFVWPGGHHRDVVILGHLVISAIEIRFVTARSRDAGARVVWDEESRRAAEELKRLHMAVDPVRHPLSKSSTCKGVGAGTEHRDKDRGRHGFTAVTVIDRDRVARPIHKRFLPRLVVLPEHDIAAAVPSLIQLAEPAVTVAVRMRFPILLPQELQRQMLVRLKLGMELGEINTRPGLRRRPQWPCRKQQLIQLLFIKIVRQRPTEMSGCRPLQISMNGRLADRATAGDLVLV